MGWWVAVALAGPGIPDPVLAPLGQGAEVDWTDLVVRITRRGQPTGSDSAYKAVEQQARQLIDEDILAASGAVAVTSELDVAGLLTGPLQSPMLARSRGWVVVEARYLSSGSVELVAELSLQELLVPWAVGLASPETPGDVVAPYTGLVLDARSTSLSPVYAPRVLGPDGEVLFDGLLVTESSVTTAPAIWVTDLATPNAARAGDQPLFATALSASGADLMVSAEAVQSVRNLVASGVLGRGALVVLVGR